MRSGRDDGRQGAPLAEDASFRIFGLRAAAARGLRLVPADPDPAAFPPRTFACDLRPFACVECTVQASCSYRRGARRPVVPG